MCLFCRMLDGFKGLIENHMTEKYILSTWYVCMMYAVETLVRDTHTNV